MPLVWRLGWRSVWRNPRRTGLTVAATVFAVFLVVVFVGMAAGVHEKMIEDSVRVNSGHVTVSGADWLEKKTLEQYLRLTPELLEILETSPGVRGLAPRLSSFALLSRDTATHGVAVVGVDPEREGSVSTLPSRVSEGRFLDGARSKGIVLGGRLAENLGARVGDELLLYSVAYSLEMAYDLFTVVGVMRVPEPELDRALALVSLADAQEFFAYGDRVTEVAVLSEDADAAPALARELEAVLPPGVEVHTWNQVMPELEQVILLDDAGMYAMLVVLVIVVAFGILNTILMSVLERKRELGVMLALGLRPRAIFRLVFVESMILAAVGLALGLLLAIPTVLYFQAHPIPITGEGMAGAVELFGIDPVVTFQLKPLNPIGSALTIFGVAAAASLYPAFRAGRTRPLDAIRGV